MYKHVYYMQKIKNDAKYILIVHVWNKLEKLEHWNGLHIMKF